MDKAKKTGKVYLVGAGPGDPELMTVKARRVLEQADVVVYDALVGCSILAMLPAGAELIDAGKRAGAHTLRQEEINRLLLEKAQEGRTVVRLKGGDPFVFGRGGEELEMLAETGTDFEVVPGVTSAFAVPAYNGIPVTHRDCCSSVHVITGHRRAEADGRIHYEALARTEGTLVFLMGLAALPEICEGLLGAGMDPDTPAAVLSRGTTARQRRIVSTLQALPEAVRQHPLSAPAIIVVGRVCALGEAFDWYGRKKLFGLRVLVTRPREFSSRMAQLLREEGAEVIELPAIRTVPAADLTQKLQRYLGAAAGPAEDRTQEEPGRFGTAAVSAADRTQPQPGAPDAVAVPENRKGAWDWVTFTSPSGVRIFLEGLKASGLDIRCLTGMKLAAIGRGTARELENAGLTVDLVPEVYDGAHLGEALAARLAPGMRVLIPRAAIGGAELLQALEHVENLTVADVAIYDTIYETTGVLDERKLFEDGEIDCATFTSASTVRAFAAAVGDMDFTKVRALCIGRQTRAAAERLGMPCVTADRADMASMIEKLEEVRARGAGWPGEMPQSPSRSAGRKEEA